MLRILRYAFDEAVRSLWRGGQAAVLSIVTIALALFVLGGFLLVTANLERLVAEWGAAAEMSVYLTDEISAGERQAIESQLAPGAVIASHEYVSKADALARFKQTFDDLAGTVDTLGGNPMPASFEVRLRAAPGRVAEGDGPDGDAARAEVEQLVSRLRQMPGVADVRYDREWLTRLLSAVTIIRSVGFALGSVLTLAAALAVANVVRLALHARRDELDIMQLVGAPLAYLRGPFLMEGVLQGGAGALVALLALAIAFFALRARYLAVLASTMNLTSMRFLTLETCVLMLVGGMAVGCLGGLVAAWHR
jgi:cell division transport system permease protein